MSSKKKQKKRKKKDSSSSFSSSSSTNSSSGSESSSSPSSSSSSSKKKKPKQQESSSSSPSSYSNSNSSSGSESSSSSGSSSESKKKKPKPQESSSSSSSTWYGSSSSSSGNNINNNSNNRNIYNKRNNNNPRNNNNNRKNNNPNRNQNNNRNNFYQNNNINKRNYNNVRNNNNPNRNHNNNPNNNYHHRNRNHNNNPNNNYHHRNRNIKNPRNYNNVRNNNNPNNNQNNNRNNNYHHRNRNIKNPRNNNNVRNNNNPNRNQNNNRNNNMNKRNNNNRNNNMDRRNNFNPNNNINKRNNKNNRNNNYNNRNNNTNKRNIKNPRNYNNVRNNNINKRNNSNNPNNNNNNRINKKKADGIFNESIRELNQKKHSIKPNKKNDGQSSNINQKHPQTNFPSYEKHKSSSSSSSSSSESETSNLSDDDFEKKLKSMEKEKVMKEKYKELREEEKQKRKEIAKRQSDSIDLCFCVDTTGSMDFYVFECQEKIFQIIKQVKKKFTNLKLRLAFVGYKDFDFKKESERYEIFDFVEDNKENLKEFQEFVSGVKCHGGEDFCEDLLGGLNKVLGLDWRSVVSIVIHFTDAPCHGEEFHDNEGDDYPDGDPNLNAKELLTEMKDRGIDYFFGEIIPDNRNELATTIMIKKFKEIYDDRQELRFIEQFKMEEEAHNFLEVVVNSVEGAQSRMTSRSTMKSISISQGMKKKKGGDNFWNPEETCKIKYIGADFNTEGFVKDPRKKVMYENLSFKIQVPIKPNSQKGRYRQNYRCRAIGIKEDICLKAGFRLKGNDGIKETEAHGECITHHLASFYAKRFNSLQVPRAINFLSVSVVHFVNRQEDMFYVCEPFFENYRAYGKDEPNKKQRWASDHELYEISETFSHWTYEHTQKKLLIDVKKCANWFLSDPVVHFANDNKIGTQSKGQKGIQNFFKRHVCNSLCKKLNLKNRQKKKSKKSEHKPSEIASMSKFIIRCSNQFCPSSITVPKNKYNPIETYKCIKCKNDKTHGICKQYLEIKKYYRNINRKKKN
ncbi:alpha-protein kinase vwka [Anaeramoeba flamelloides]|uniref:Alpha-protein kinase vwka n=1 Tax=Anaeramoeba flamelloides TaxID=1746091 RepID=A0AAV7ZSF2_9EUKA|nr:alpha-protein kinase vwka [Anaeramoeba flamelloides]